MQTAAAKTETPEGFSDEEFARFEKFQAAREAKLTAAEREKVGLATEASLRRNETGNPVSLPFGCSFEAYNLATEIRCDGADPACRLRASKPLAAPGELFWVPIGHRKGILNPALPEIDPASVTDEPTAQDRLLLGELRSFEQRAEGPATQATRNRADLEAQKQVLIEKIAQQQAELDRRRAHVEAVKAKSEEFLGSRSEAWRAALLGGAAEVSLEAIKQAAAEAERRRPQVHSLRDLKRAAQADDGGPRAYGVGGVRLPVDRDF